MRFKPCIDIHDGQVKQIVGGDLTDDKSHDNFVSKKSAAYYAELYKEKKLPGGHIILLNPKGTKEYELDKIQALEALKTYPGGMQIGGGIDEENAEEFVSAGASHVIMTSRLFDGKIFDWNRLKKISEKIGREHIVVDISCRKHGEEYVVVKDRWKTFTDMTVNENNIKRLTEFTDELLIHAVDVEGLRLGIDKELIAFLGNCADMIKITYAGGINNLSDIETIGELGGEKIDFTVGSALDLFGGNLKFNEIANMMAERRSVI